jgi:energy-coupling factor transport system ATP-binding protein
METIARLNKDKGITVILITHHMDEAALADRVVVIHRGVIRADGVPKTVFADIDYMHELGLAAPETVELCHELNKLGFGLPLDLLDTEDCAQALYKALGGN